MNFLISPENFIKIRSTSKILQTIKVKQEKRLQFLQILEEACFPDQSFEQWLSFNTDEVKCAKHFTYI